MLVCKFLNKIMIISHNSRKNGIRKTISEIFSQMGKMISRNLWMVNASVSQRLARKGS